MLIFDMDGTLIDSNGIWRQVDEAFLAKRGYPYTREYYEGVAHTIFPMAAKFTKAYCHLEESEEEIMAEWMQMAGDAYAVRVPIKPGVRAYLDRCRAAGERMIVLTSSVPEHCRAALRRLGLTEYFERILFARGQEELWDTDELYAQLGSLPPERVAEIWAALEDAKWQFLSEEQRMQFLLTWLPEFEHLFDLFSDFRSSGYRILSNLLCDILQENEQQTKRQLHRPGDSPVFDELMEAYLSKRNSQHYREAVSARCRKLLNKIVRPQMAVSYMEALGKRNLLWDLLLDALESNVLEVYHAE